MSKKFAIRSTRPLVQKSGGAIIFGTGEDVPFSHTCELTVFQVDKDKFEYVTGLEERHIKYSKHFSEEEIKILLKQQKEDRKALEDAYGKERLAPTNHYFWEGKSAFRLNNEVLGMFFDTREPEHLLLYWKIMGGGYDDEIGPTHSSAAARALPFYMTESEEEAERRGEATGHKVKAFSLLEELKDKKSAEDMLWLAWILHPANRGYTKATPPATLYQAHAEFIEGLLKTKSKKSCPKQFIEAVTLIKTDRTRAIAQAVVHAGDYLGIIFPDKEGKIRMKGSETILGKELMEVVDTLLKPANYKELEALRDEVEKRIE